jgi:N-methylhydantoinase B
MNTSLIRYRSVPRGLFGGGAGRGNETVVDEAVTLHRASRHPLAGGSVVSHRMGGGGGYGNALDRPVELVIRDVLYGYITTEAARRDYGVAIDEKGRVDEAETARIRSDGRGGR